MIPDDTIAEIRQRVDIVAVIGEHVQLRKAGINHKGLCPFHHENTPSFNVNGGKGFFYCFGCQKKGDVFSFVMELGGKSFVEAATELAARVGVAIPERPMTDGERRARSEQSRLYEVNRVAASYYRDTLLDDERGEAARRYLAGRGIDAATAERFELGYAPDGWDGLAQHLAARKLSAELGERAGLLVRRPRGPGFYDRFRDRLMCPVILPGGEVAGFSGRRLGTSDDAGAKYLNTPETPVFKKSRLLFGLHRAREAFRRAGRAIVVEGNFDVVSLHQHGFEETVAPLGTALADGQVEQLRRLADSVVLVYDGDRAGRAATLKALRALVAAGVPTRIAALPAGQDPDSLVRDGGPERMATLLVRAQPAVEYFSFEVWGASRHLAESRAAALAEAADVLSAENDPVKLDFYIGTFADAMQVDNALVRRVIAQHRAAAARGAGPEGGRGTATRAPESKDEPPHAVTMAGDVRPRPTGPSRGEQRRPVPVAELKILSILAHHPQLLEQSEKLGVFSLLTDALLRDMYSAALRGESIVSAVPDGADPQIAEHMFAGVYASLQDPGRTLSDAANELRVRREREGLGDLKRRVAEARRRGQVELERQLVEQIVTTRRQVD
jgi:DNA primase